MHAIKNQYRLAGIAVALLHAPTVHAQAHAGEVPSVPEVIISGTSTPQQDAERAKLDYNGIADAAGAAEVQALPATSPLDLLRRLPGVAMLPAQDNERPRDEAAAPVIRGLGAAYNPVTIDGIPVASPGIANGNGSASRGARLNLLPSSMIGEMIVSKTFLPDQDAHGIGGAIDLRTRSAFAHAGKDFFALDAAIGKPDDSAGPRRRERLGQRLAATGSTTFGPQQRYGLVVSASYQATDSTADAHMTTDSTSESFYNAAGILQSGANQGNGFAVPQQDKYWHSLNQRSRYGLTAKLEARVSGTLQAFVTGGRYVTHDTMERNELIIDPRNRSRVLDQSATSGRYAAGDVEVGYSRQAATTASSLLQAGTDWEVAPNRVASLRTGVSRASYREPILMVKYSTGSHNSAPGAGDTSPTPTPDFAISYDTQAFDHSFNISPSAYYKLENYRLNYYRPDSGFQRNAGNEIQYLRLDFRSNSDGRGWGYAAGASFTRDASSYSLVRTQFSPNTSAKQGTLADVLGPTGPRLKYNQSNLDMLTIDPQRAAAYVDTLRAAGGLNAVDQSALSNQDNYEHTERIAGAYGMLAYAAAGWKTRFGVHLDSTRQATLGRARVAGKWTDLPTASRYHFALPSALATYQWSPAIDVRIGASQTIGRPAYDSYAARSSIDFQNPGERGNAGATGVTVMAGNPDIKPRLSTNTDLGINWKLPSQAGGLLSAAVFNKGIKDEIFTSSSLGYTYEGVNYANAVVTKPVNAASASVRGLEISTVVNSLAWLHPMVRDFGFSANWTLLKGRMEVLKSDKQTRTVGHLAGQPGQMRNLSVFYSNSALELRAAYNYQSQALRAVVPDIEWQDLYWAPRHQVDLQASYRLQPGLTLVAQVQNLTGERLTSTVGASGKLLKDSHAVPTLYWFGLRYTPTP
ncbi:MAG TPA: TonB-dependent receptor [Pseudoduganella sp.]